MSQLLRNIPWLSHTTSPVWLTITFVLMTAELYCGSALRTEKTGWFFNDGRLTRVFRSISKLLSYDTKISHHLLPLFLFFSTFSFPNHFFFFLSSKKESWLTCCRESCPASRRDCKEHGSLGSQRTPRRSISGDGPSKSVSPSNWSSVSDSSRPASEKSKGFIRTSDRNNIGRKMILLESIARDKSPFVLGDLWSPRSRRCMSSSKVWKETYTGRNEYKSIFPG